MFISDFFPLRWHTRAKKFVHQVLTRMCCYHTMDESDGEKTGLCAVLCSVV